MIGLMRWLTYGTLVVAVWALDYDKLIAVGINVIAMILCQNREYWIGQQVLDTWDCELDGGGLVINSGKEVSLTHREFMAWSCSSHPIIVQQCRLQQ